MVDALGLRALQIGLGAAEPEQVAEDDHLSVVEGLAVVADQSLHGEGKEAIDAAVDETIGLPGLAVEEMR